MSNSIDTFGIVGLGRMGADLAFNAIGKGFTVAGFDPHGALHAARLFTGFLYGHVLHELQEQVQDPDETDDLLRLGLHRLPIAQFPRLRSLASALAAYDGAAELDEGLTIVLAGLRSQLRT